MHLRAKALRARSTTAAVARANRVRRRTRWPGSGRAISRWRRCSFSRPGVAPQGRRRTLRDARSRPAGQRPVNTSGGGLSYRHRGMVGVFVPIGAARHIRGKAGTRQGRRLPDRIARGNGVALSSQGTVLLGDLDDRFLELPSAVVEILSAKALLQQLLALKKTPHGLYAQGMKNRIPVAHKASSMGGTIKSHPSSSPSAHG